MNSNLELIEKASCSEDVFGVLDEARAEVDFRRRFRVLARDVHPDLHGGDRRAEKAFVRLGEFAAEAERRIQAKVYGTSRPTPPTGPTILTHQRQRYDVEGLLAQGDLCDVFGGTYEEGRERRRCVVKITRSMTDNDLATNEVTVLRILAESDLGARKRYVSKLVDSFRLPDPTLGPRQVTVLKRIDGAYSLQEVASTYPNGVCLEDAVWIFNRMLEGLGYVHRKGYVHGAVLPAHVLVRPRDHGGKLVDWSYAVPCGERVRALPTDWRALYAPEILKKEATSSSTDIYMAAGTVAWLLGATSRGEVPEPRPDDETKKRAAEQFAAFLRTCLAERVGARIQDAWQVRKSLDEMMQRLYGPRKFHLFEMPPKT